MTGIIEELNGLSNRWFRLGFDKTEKDGKIYHCNSCTAIYRDHTSAEMHSWKEHDEYVSESDLALYFKIERLVK